MAVFSFIPFLTPYRIYHFTIFAPLPALTFCHLPHFRAPYRFPRPSIRQMKQSINQLISNSISRLIDAVTNESEQQSMRHSGRHRMNRRANHRVRKGIHRRINDRINESIREEIDDASRASTNSPPKPVGKLKNGTVGRAIKR